MELIKTCINKEPNANPSDVSPNVVLFVSWCLHYLDLKVYIMQALMEFIKTCINKEPNANPSIVSPNVVLFISYCLHY